MHVCVLSIIKDYNDQYSENLLTLDNFNVQDKGL